MADQRQSAPDHSTSRSVLYKDLLIDLMRKTMRPHMAYLFGWAAVVLVFMDKLDAKVVETVALMVISFLFGERSALKRPGSQEEE